MLDPVSLDQLRTFVAAADEGNFSAAARHLGRAQSVVSQTLANLEGQLGVKLFDRAGHKPVLTDQGRALLEKAREVAGRMDAFKASAKGLASGLEPELSIVVDVMFPINQVTAAVDAFRYAFPDTPLRLEVEALGAVLQPVLEGRCAFGIMGSLPTAPPQLTTERLSAVNMVVVVSPLHPLGRHHAPVPEDVVKQHVQLVLSDRSTLSQGKQFGVISQKTWRLADLGAKHSFLRAGLGWGGMPFDLVAADLVSGHLMPLDIEGHPSVHTMTMSAAYPTDSSPGPAGRWMIERLKAAASA